jgi:Protein of unknown function (DUF4242)
VTADGRRFFLVERYVPEAGVRSVAAAAQRLESVDGARHVGTVVIAAEETALSVFEADDARSVAAANEAAGLPLNRIVEAEWYPGSPT